MRNKTWIYYLILALIAILFLMPMLWLVLSSFNVHARQALKWPDQWTFNNYLTVIQNGRNLRGFGIGLYISVAQASLVCILSLMAAYPLSRYDLSYKKPLLYAILFMTSLPMIAVIVPVYKIFVRFHLLDSIPGVILYLTASGIPYGVWMMKNFMEQIQCNLCSMWWRH